MSIKDLLRSSSNAVHLGNAQLKLPVLSLDVLKK